MAAQTQKNSENDIQGILLIDKPRGKTAFFLVAILRRLLGVKKIGHAGTLDPFATGVMVMLIGRQYTRLSDQFLCCDKEYEAEILLGVTTDSYDCDGAIQSKSNLIPTREALDRAVLQFQGEIEQVPPMFSAKKINGKKLYELARKGKTIERQAAKVTVDMKVLSYEYPYVKISVKCSKGTYIRSLAHDLGIALGCGGHLINLRRTRSGNFKIADCFDGELLQSPLLDLSALQEKICTSDKFPFIRDLKHTKD